MTKTRNTAAYGVANAAAQYRSDENSLPSRMTPGPVEALAGVPIAAVIDIVAFPSRFRIPTADLVAEQLRFTNRDRGRETW
jgi:hypothetical protein